MFFQVDSIHVQRNTPFVPSKIFNLPFFKGKEKSQRLNKFPPQEGGVGNHSRQKQPGENPARFFFGSKIYLQTSPKKKSFVFPFPKRGHIPLSHLSRVNMVWAPPFLLPPSRRGLPKCLNFFCIFNSSSLWVVCVALLVITCRVL